MKQGWNRGECKCPRIVQYCKLSGFVFNNLNKCAKTEAMVIGVSFSDQYELFYAITLDSYYCYQLLGVDFYF
jgi:hypothetical protein